MFVGFARGETFAKSLAALAVLAAATFAVVAPAKSADPVSGPGGTALRLFGASENTNGDISPFPKWTAVLARYAGERHLEDAPCKGGRCALQDWKAFVMTLQGQDRMRQLEAVNAYVNRVPYLADDRRFGVVVYWATPKEFFGKSGDCEDYAIAKYLSLRKLGWPASELRITVLKDEVRNELHAVLIAYVGGTAYVLDNLTPAVREHAAIRNYRPIFSINEAAWHYHRDWNPASAVMVAKVEQRAPGGYARTMPGSQVAGPVPPAIDTVGPATRPAAREVRSDAYLPPLVRPAQRSYAANTGESLGALFSNSGSAH